MKNTATPSDSFTSVDPDYLLDLCKQMLDKKLRETQELQEPLIQKLMKKTWFRPARTREEVIEQNFGKLWDSYQFALMDGEYRIARAQNLVSLATIAKHSFQKVHLGSADAKILVAFT